MFDTNSIYNNFVMLAVAHNRFYRPVEDIKVRIVNPCLWLNTFYIVLYTVNSSHVSSKCLKCLTRLVCFLQNAVTSIAKRKESC